MYETVPVAQLRQNPAPALKAVAEGRTLVVTNHNRPVADLVPHTERKGVSPKAFADALRRTPVDPHWLDEVTSTRLMESDDPWDQIVTAALLDTPADIEGIGGLVDIVDV